MSYRFVKTAIEARGFATVEAVFATDELREVELLLDGLMHSGSRTVTCFRREMAEQVVAEGHRQPELSRPALLSKRLRQGSVYAKCQAIAADVFGGKAHYLFDHAIYKMPQSGTITPWHQDQAYLGAGIELRSLHFWIPFQDSSELNGAMRFVANSVPVLLPHVQVFKHNPHLLGIETEPTEGVHELTLRTGDVSIHNNMTLHATGANRSDHVRKAWVIHFGDRPAWYKHWLQIKSRFAG